MPLKDVTNEKEGKCIVLDDKDQEIPDPFPFPNFPLEVALLLQKQTITVKAFRELISGVSRTMFSFRRHPTQEERHRVALQVIAKYPAITLQ